MTVLALAAVALALGIAAWVRQRIAALPAIAVLLGTEAVALVLAEVFAPSSPSVLLAVWSAMLVISLATTGAVAALAFATRSPLAITAAACWTLWWVLDAIFYLWAIESILSDTVRAAPSFDLVPVLAGALAALLVGLFATTQAKQPAVIALVAVLAGFLVVWCLGESWMRNVTGSDDADRIHAVRRFSNVGYVGWHAVLAVLLWKTAAGNLPRARVVSS